MIGEPDGYYDAEERKEAYKEMKDDLVQIVYLFDSPVRCTTPEPAKSREPTFSSGIEFEKLKNPLSDQTECAI